MGREDLHGAKNQVPAGPWTPGSSPKPQPFLHQQTAHPPTPARWENEQPREGLGWGLKCYS